MNLKPGVELSPAFAVLILSKAGAVSAPSLVLILQKVDGSYLLRSTLAALPVSLPCTICGNQVAAAVPYCPQQ